MGVLETGRLGGAGSILETHPEGRGAGAGDIGWGREMDFPKQFSRAPRLAGRPRKTWALKLGGLSGSRVGSRSMGGC